MGLGSWIRDGVRRLVSRFLEHELESLRGRLGELGVSVMSLRSCVESLSREVAEVRKMVREIEAGLGSGLVDIRRRLEEVEGRGERRRCRQRIDELESRLGELSERVGELEQLLQDALDRLAVLEGAPRLRAPRVLRTELIVSGCRRVDEVFGKPRVVVDGVVVVQLPDGRARLVYRPSQSKSAREILKKLGGEIAETRVLLEVVRRKS